MNLQLSLFEEEDRSEEMPSAIPQRVQYGDIWQLGQHRLVCGDATDDGDIARLMRKEQAALGLHDPPYGLRTRMAWGFGDGKKVGKAHRGVFEPVRNDDKPFDPRHLLASGSTVIIWGANHFSDKLPPSPAWILWDKRVDLPSNDMSDGEAAWVSCGNTLRIIRHKWNGFDRASERGEPRVHPTQKPVFLFRELIKRYSQKGGIITDWYAGSGTTLIAAECEKRRAYVIEIEMHYCDVILARWEKCTGQKAVLIERVAKDKAS